MTNSSQIAASELLIFELAAQEFALDISVVREIRGVVQTTPLPHAPPYMKGVINLRGTVLPVMDLGARLGFVTLENSKTSVIIVTSHGNSLTGLYVDAVRDILTISFDDIQAPPQTSTQSDASFVRGLALIEDRLIRVLDLAALVALPDAAPA